MQSLPMDAPRRSFVMSAPTPMPVRARPNLALRAPNWVYADAASVAALFLAVTISVDATGGLTSAPPRHGNYVICHPCRIDHRVAVFRRGHIGRQ